MRKDVHEKEALIVGLAEVTAKDFISIHQLLPIEVYLCFRLI
jgi:hypothetical protein